MDIYAEILKWQRQLQSKSISQTEVVLSQQMEQLARVSILLIS